MNHAPRVSRAYDDISGGLQEWCDIAERCIVVEHGPDQGCNKTHVHLGIWNCGVKAEALKRRFKTKTGLKLSGNADWAWEHKDHPAGLPDFEEDVQIDGMIVPTPKSIEIFNYLKYLIKGDLSRVKLVKNISPALLERARESWVDSVKNDNSPQVIHIEHVKVKSPPYQQTVICDATEQWLIYKRECKEKGEEPDEVQVMEMVCNAMRKVSKGINPHMVRDLSYAVLYDDAEYKDLILKKVKRFF